MTKTFSTLALFLLLAAATAANASTGSLTEYAAKDHNARWVGEISNLSHTGLDTYTGTWPGIDNSRGHNARTLRITLNGASSLTIDELESHQSYSGIYRKDANGTISFHVTEDGGMFEGEGVLSLD